MDLKTYVSSNRGEGAKISGILKIDPAYFSQLMSGNRAISPARAVTIEAATNGAVTRQELRPNDWQLIWPELIKTAA